MFRQARLVLLILAATGGAFWWGGHNLMIGLHNRAPVEITCADYVAHPPDAEWLHLTHCQADIPHLAYEQDTGGSHRVSKVYIPLIPEGSPDGTLAKIITERSDPEICELAQAIDAAQTHDRDVGDVTVARMIKATDGANDGVIERGIDLSDSDQKQLAGMGLNLAPEFAILDRDAHPRPLIFAIIALVAGCLGLLLLGSRLVRRFGSAGSS